MFLASQNLKDVCITYFLLELLIFFCLTVVDICCLKFVSHYIKEILYVNTGPNETNHEKKTFSVVSDTDVEKSCFLLM